MSSYSLKIFKAQPTRFILSIGGIGLCIILMLFLLASYNGVKIGSMEYITQNKTDLWVMQKNASNIMRCTSVLFPKHLKAIRKSDGVESAAPVLLILTPIKKGNKVATVYLAGYDINEERGDRQSLGGPPVIIEGRSIKNDNEIVLDESFVKKYDYFVGEKIIIQNDTLLIVGISQGTNAFVIQYAFVTLKKAQSLVNFPIATCYLVNIKIEYDLSQVVSNIKKELPDVEIFDHETFIANNLNEMQAGFLPFIYSIVIICAIVLTVIISLLLSISILERRKDFAVMKILGSNSRYLVSQIFGQSFLLCLFGMIVASILFYPLVRTVALLAPEITIKSSLMQFWLVFLMAGAISILSAFLSLHRLRNIYPLEVFYEPG
ncbi:MAG: FtsX-like permease family protein [candidate division Zixibacteria bacterium]|nr:FtsX-like permease family protein [candidate division Zixibacteria bacterium]